MRLHYFFLPLSLLVSCGHKEPPPPPVYLIFQVPLTIAPVRNVYSVGDTLWLNADFSDQLSEYNSKKPYPVTPSNFDLHTIIGLLNLKYPDRYLGSQPGAVDNFTIINKLGSIDGLGQTYGNISYHYSSNRYRLLIGIIPRDPGVFCFSLFDGWKVKKSDKSYPDLSYIDIGTTADRKPQKAVLSTIFYYINNGKNNFALLSQYSQLSSSINPSTENNNFEQEATYTFIVK